MSTNLFSQFRRLLPAQPLVIGQVISAAGGTVQVQLPGGDVIAARGSASVSAMVLVRDGAVEATVPSLTSVSATV